MPPPEYLTTLIRGLWDSRQQQTTTPIPRLPTPLASKPLPPQRYEILSKGPRLENRFGTQIPERKTSIPTWLNKDSPDESPGLTDIFDKDDGEEYDTSDSSAPDIGGGYPEVAIAARENELEELCKNHWL
jgi:hypothetical protein